MDFDFVLPVLCWANYTHALKNLQGEGGKNKKRGEETGTGRGHRNGKDDRGKEGRRSGESWGSGGGGIRKPGRKGREGPVNPRNYFVSPGRVIEMKQECT